MMKSNLCWITLTLMCEAFLFCWVIFAFLNDSPSYPLYLAERVFILIWVFAQFVSSMIKLMVAIIALISPVTLLNEPMQQKWHNLYLWTLLGQCIIFFSVIFIDAWKYLFLLFDIQFTYKDPSEDDLAIDLIVRMS